MTTIARVILVAVLACASGCARPDWIQDTLVTVDVTGKWERVSGGPVFTLDLEQQGPKVKGTVVMMGTGSSVSISAPIDDTVAGDTFRFRPMTEPTTGEATVSGDEMLVNVRGSGTVVADTRAPIILRRVDSSAPPSPQKQ